MTTYTSIPNADIDQDSPVTQTLMTALRDNPIAITEGASGAPRIVAAGIEGGDSSTSGQVYVSDGDGTGTWALAEGIGANKDLVGTDGYVKLPGGVILQWGLASAVASTTSVTFPIEFTNACLNVTPSRINPTQTGTANQVILRSYTTTGASFGTNSSEDFLWTAIGY